MSTPSEEDEAVDAQEQRLVANGRPFMLLLKMEAMHEVFSKVEPILPHSEAADVARHLRSAIPPLRAALRARGVPLNWKSEFVP